jgi:hypothetical protein
LLGKDHPELGAIAVSAVSPSLAIATSAGARPKLSRIVERNEDACAVARGPRAELLAVADAHYGSTAARRAVEVVLDAFAGNVPPANLPSAELERIVFEVGSAIAHQRTPERSARGRRGLRRGRRGRRGRVRRRRRAKPNGAPRTTPGRRAGRQLRVAQGVVAPGLTLLACLYPDV